MDTYPVQFLFDIGETEPQRHGACVWVLNLDDKAVAAASEALDGGRCGGPPANHAVARRLVATYLGVEAKRVVFTRDGFGRLAMDTRRLGDCAAATSLDISIACSEGILVAGLIASGRIGVDVEVIRAGIDADKVARCHFARSEQERLQSLSASERIAAFYRCWTAKEAFAKAIGLGLSAGLDQIETAMGSDGSLRISRLHGSVLPADGWNLVQRDAVVGGVPAIVAAAFSDGQRRHDHAGAWCGHGAADGRRDEGRAARERAGA